MLLQTYFLKIPRPFVVLGLRLPRERPRAGRRRRDDPGHRPQGLHALGAAGFRAGQGRNLEKRRCIEAAARIWFPKKIKKAQN